MHNDDMTAPCGLPCFECYLYLAQFDQKMAEMIAGVLNLSTDKIKSFLHFYFRLTIFIIQFIGIKFCKIKGIHQRFICSHGYPFTMINKNLTL